MAEFVHVVALVGTGTGIHKGEHAGYEQSGFMMRHRIRSCKNGTGFTVFALAVAEEQGIRSRVVMPQLTGLPHETTGKHGAVVHARPGGYDKVIANNAMPYMYRCYFVTVDTAVVQATCTANVAVVADTHVFDRTGIEYHYMAADRTDSGGMLIGVEIGNFLHPRNQLRAVTVKCHDIGLVGGEFIADKHFTAACLVQHRHLYAVTELGQPVYEDNIHILDEGIVSDFIIGNIVLDILNAAVIAHCYIMECYVPQAGMFLYSARQGKFRPEHSQTYLAREAGMIHEFR